MMARNTIDFATLIRRACELFDDNPDMKRIVLSTMCRPSYGELRSAVEFAREVGLVLTMQGPFGFVIRRVSPAGTRRSLGPESPENLSAQRRPPQRLAAPILLRGPVQPGSR